MRVSRANSPSMWSTSTPTMKRPPPSAARRGSPLAISHAAVSDARRPSVVRPLGVSGVCRSGRTRTRARRTSHGLVTTGGRAPGAATAILQELAQSPEGLVDARQAVRIRKPEVALAARSEIDARGDGDAGAGQDLEREVVGPLGVAPRVREHVERPGRLGPDREPERPE